MSNILEFILCLTLRGHTDILVFQGALFLYLKILRTPLKALFTLRVNHSSRKIPVRNMNRIDASLWVYISDQASSELYYFEISINIIFGSNI